MAENKNLREFMKKLEKDEELLKGLQEATDKDPEKGAYKFALEHSNGGFSEEEFIDQIEKLLNKSIDQLDEQMLENVAGGDDTDNKYTVSAAREEGKWKAIAAGINAIGPVTNFVNTFASIIITFLKRKDEKKLTKIKIDEEQLKYMKGLLAFMKEYNCSPEDYEQLKNSMNK